MRKVVRTFEQFEADLQKMGRKAVGLAIIYDNHILLVREVSDGDDANKLGIPKGRKEDGESVLDGAIRETEEETGLTIPRNKIKSKAYKCTLKDKPGRPKKTLIYFICEIDDLSELGLSDMNIPEDKLQTEEIKWGGFLTGMEAYRRTVNSQRIILDRHIKL
jgi:8-oxo-dGTP pyrophosphatase MutT (NUDIX family)